MPNSRLNLSRRLAAPANLQYVAQGAGRRTAWRQHLSLRPQCSSNTFCQAASRMRTRSNEDFAAAVVAQFPGLRAEIEAANGGLDAAMSAFGVFTQSAKIRGDWPTYERCVALAGRLLASADSPLATAFQASYFEHLDFEGGRGPAAWQLLTPALQSAWKQMDGGNRRWMALPQGRSKESPDPRRTNRGKTPRGPGGGREPKGPKGPKGPRGPQGTGGRRGGHRGRS